MRGRGLNQVVVAHALVDDDFAALALLKWYFDKDGYVRRSRYDSTSRSLKNITLHREVMGQPDGLVDHKDGNKLDCRRTNLRVATHQANMQNRSPLSGRGSSRHRGVTWNASARKWQASGRARYLGLFDTEQEAADAAAAWRREHMPDALQDAR